MTFGICLHCTAFVSTPHISCRAAGILDGRTNKQWSWSPTEHWSQGRRGLEPDCDKAIVPEKCLMVPWREREAVCPFCLLDFPPSPSLVGCVSVIQPESGRHSSFSLAQRVTGWKWHFIESRQARACAPSAAFSRHNAGWRKKVNDLLSWKIPFAQLTPHLYLLKSVYSAPSTLGDCRSQTRSERHCVGVCGDLLCRCVWWLTLPDITQRRPVWRVPPYM